MICPFEFPSVYEHGCNIKSRTKFFNAVAKFNGLAPKLTFRNGSAYATEYIWENFGRYYTQDADGNKTEVLTPYGYLAKAGQLEFNFGLTMHVNSHSHWTFIFKDTTFIYPYVPFFGTSSG